LAALAGDVRQVLCHVSEIPESVHVLSIRALVREQEELAIIHNRRTEISRAIELANSGFEPGIADFDPGDPAQATAIATAEIEIRAELGRRKQIAAIILGTSRLRGRPLR
jgi:hypothetical protein